MLETTSLARLRRCSGYRSCSPGIRQATARVTLIAKALVANRRALATARFTRGTDEEAKPAARESFRIGQAPRGPSRRQAVLSDGIGSLNLPEGAARPSPIYKEMMVFRFDSGDRGRGIFDGTRILVSQ